MSTLDDKLRGILQDYDHDPVQQEGILDEIKQAFADEGYRQVVDLSPDIAMWKGKRLMTGQKWFDEFQDELDDAKRWTSMDGTIVMSPNAALEAARKVTND